MRDKVAGHDLIVYSSALLTMQRFSVARAILA
jgi:hypothetical protein